MKKNVGGQKIGAQLVSSSDGSNFTGTVTVYVTGDAGTQALGAVGSGVCTHEGNGYHTYSPAQAETNYDLIAFTFVGTGAVSATVQVYTAYPQTGDSYAEVTTRLPAALISGRMDSNVQATAASLTFNLTGNVSGSVGSISGITFPTNFDVLDINGSGHIVRVTFVDATQVDDIWLTSLPGSYTGTQAGKVLSDILVDTGTTLQAELDGIQEDTENIQSRLPTALFNGRMDSNVQATASNLTFDITGSMTGSVGSVTGAVGSVTGAVGSVTGNVGGNVTGSVGSINGITFPTNFAAMGINASGHVSRVTLVDTTTTNTDRVSAASIADAVWDETVADHLTAGSAGANLNVAFSATDPWSTALPGAYTGSQAGKIIADILVDTGTTLQGELDGIQADTEDIQTRLPAALVSGRMDSNVQASAAGLTFDLTGSVSGSVGSVTGAVGSVTGAVGSVTGNVGGNVTGSVGSISGITFPSNFASLGINASGHVSRVTLVDTTTTNTDLVSAASVADAVWDEATASHASGGTFGLALSDILVDTGTTLQGELDGIQADTEDIQTRLPAALVSGRMDVSVGAMAANVVTASALASDAVTEIAAGTITAANVTAVLDRLGYLMATIHGVISNARTATETFVITIDGTQYTAAYTGLTEAGNRSTTTLSKV